MCGETGLGEEKGEFFFSPRKYALFRDRAYSLGSPGSLRVCLLGLLGPYTGSQPFFMSIFTEIQLLSENKLLSTPAKAGCCFSNSAFEGDLIPLYLLSLCGADSQQ